MPDSSDNVNSGARASAVDWSRPIEAVHEDGRVVPVTGAYAGDGEYRLGKPLELDPDQAWYFLPDGKQRYALSDCHGGGKPWRIRNVQPTTPERDPALWDRMEALVRNMVREDTAHWSGDYVIARAIVADLPKPVDPDLIEAREVVAKWRIAYGEEIRRGEAWQEMVEAVRMGIVRGRELAAPEVSHVG